MENTIEAACSVEVIIKLFPSKYIYTKNDGKCLNYMHLISYQSPIKVHSWRVAHNYFKHFTIASFHNHYSSNTKTNIHA